MGEVIAGLILLAVFTGGYIYSDYRLETDRRRTFFKETRMREIEQYDGN